MIRRAAVSIPLNATREAAWTSLTDLENAAAWLPGIAGAEVLTSEGDISVIELIIDGRPLVLEVVASPPNGARFQQVEHWRTGAVSGSWNLRDDATAGLVLDVEIRASTPMLAVGSGRRLRRAVDQAVMRIQDLLRRPSTAQIVTYRRALAVVRRGDIIEAHIGDQVVELLRIGGDE